MNYKHQLGRTIRRGSRRPRCPRCPRSTTRVLTLTVYIYYITYNLSRRTWRGSTPCAFGLVKATVAAAQSAQPAGVAALWMAPELLDAVAAGAAVGEQHVPDGRLSRPEHLALHFRVGPAPAPRPRSHAPPLRTCTMSKSCGSQLSTGCAAGSPNTPASFLVPNAPSPAPKIPTAGFAPKPPTAAALSPPKPKPAARSAPPRWASRCSSNESGRQVGSVELWCAGVASTGPAARSPSAKVPAPPTARSTICSSWATRRSVQRLPRNALHNQLLSEIGRTLVRRDCRSLVRKNFELDLDHLQPPAVKSFPRTLAYFR